MVYEYKVKHNGKWYLPGQTVPEDIEKPEQHTKSEIKGITKTEINRMSTADLQRFATEKGIANAYSLSGADIKKILIEQMNL